MPEFSWPVRIYYEDTDSGGVVYYANYLKFMERARTEYLRSLGFEQDQLARDHGVIFAVRSAHLEFHKPARFNELLMVTASVADLGRASLSFEQRVLRQSDADPLCAGRVKVACLDAGSFRPKAIPDVMLAEIPSGS